MSQYNGNSRAPGDIVPGPCDLGLGLFALRDFGPGELLFLFEGPVVSSAVVNARGERQANPLQVGPDQYIDVQPPGVFINHSCDPNAGVRNDVEVVALRHIAVGEEIRFDYSTSMCEGHWTMACRCGAPSCRELVTDFRDLPRDLRIKYLTLGIVQSFIVEEIERAVADEVPSRTD